MEDLAADAKNLDANSVLGQLKERLKNDKIYVRRFIITNSEFIKRHLRAERCTLFTSAASKPDKVYPETSSEKESPVVRRSERKEFRLSQLRIQTFG